MPKPAQHEDSPGSRAMLWFGVALALLSCLPFLVARWPQLTDYPSHLARYHVMLNGNSSAVLRQYYEFDWIFTGNLGADLLMWPLGKLLGVEAAGRIVGMIIPPLTGLGLISVAWTLRKRIGVGVLLAFATIWSPAMSMGFYNFCLSIALALFAFAAWIRLDGKRWRWAVMLPAGLVIWLCHASGWGVLGVLVFGYEWHCRRNLTAFIAPWPLLGPVVPMVLGGTVGSLSFGTDILNYKTGIWAMALAEQSFQLDFLSLVVLVLAIAAAALARKIDGRVGWAALILAALTIIMPRHFGGGDFADLRLVAVTLMIGCLAIDWHPRRLFLVLAAALFIVRLTSTTLVWRDADQRLHAAMGALRYLPEGARVAGAVAVDTKRWAVNPFEHAPSYATVYRDALVNSHFAIPGVHMLHVRGLGSDFVDPSQRVFYRDGQPIDLTAFPPLRHADYLWYFGTEMPARLPAGAKVIYRTPDSFLARLAKPERAR